MTLEDQQLIRRARAGLSRVIEPRDAIGHVLIKALGPVVSWEIVSSGRRLSAEESLALTQAMQRAPEAVGGSMATAAQRWKARASVVDTDADRRALEDVGGWLCVPEDDDWPAQLDQLGLQSPVALWGRGRRTALGRWPRDAVAIVGSRDVTSYGRSITFDLAGPWPRAVARSSPAEPMGG